MLVDFLRHGETDTPGRLLGRSDPALSALGWQQVERQVAGRQWDLIVASPRQRSLAPAARIAEAQGLAPRIDESWAEMDFGAWDGRLLAELAADAAISSAFAALYADPNAPSPPGGESWAGLTQRVGGALEKLQCEPAERVLVLTHGGPMRAALHLACGLPFTALWALRIEPGTRMTLRLGKSDPHGLWGEMLELVQP